MVAYYNEIEPYAAQWLRNLIAGGVIAPGDVDERDIRDVKPSDLVGYSQCHFFAGLGGWSYALRNAGWSDDRPVWTFSCPCQPFSSAGKGLGFADERHLWPAMFHLLRIGRPPDFFGEQVESKVGYAWIDLVQADVEGEDFAIGPVPFPAAGIGAPNIRHRFYFAGRDLRAGPLADPDHAQRWANRAGRHDGDRASAEWHQGDRDARQCGGNGLRSPVIIGGGSDVGRLANPDHERCGEARRAGQERSDRRDWPGGTCSLSHWPTPRASVAGPDYAVMDRPDSGGLSLATLAATAAPWKTPRHNDYKGAVNVTTGRSRRKPGDFFLPEQVVNLVMADAARGGRLEERPNKGGGNAGDRS